MKVDDNISGARCIRMPIENICMTHLLFIQVSDLWRVALLALLSSRYVQQGKYYTNSTP